MKKPNILYIMTDQHRFDSLSCTGNRGVRTPNIDSIAESGANFRNACTPSPVCAPARAAIFSGQYPPGCGVTGNWLPFNGNQVLMTDQLKRAGYDTACVGKLHFVPHVCSWGFDHKELHDCPCSIYADDDKYSAYIDYLKEVYGEKAGAELVKMFDEDELCYPKGMKQFILGRNFIPEEHHMVTWTANRSVEYLKNREKSNPFFMHVSFMGPHQPWDVPENWRRIKPEDIKVPEFDDDYSDKPIILKTKQNNFREFKKQLTKDDYRFLISQYLNHVEMIDHYIGKLFEQLKQSGEWDNTMIIFTSDHGDHNGQYGLFFKGTMLETSVKVPLIIKPPGGIAEKEVVDPVSLLDLYGSILDTAGISDWKYEQIESGSLNNYLKMPSTTGPGKCFSYHRNNGATVLTMYRDGKFKLVRCEKNDAPILYEFYELKAGRLDGGNLFDFPAYQSKIRDMKKILDDWSEQQKTPAAHNWRKSKP